MRIVQEETFGPVAPLIRFRTEAEGLAMAHGSELAPAGCCYARDVGRVYRVAEGAEVGVVGVNMRRFQEECQRTGKWIDG